MPEVLRVRTAAGVPIDSVAEALMTNVPAVVLLIVTVQVAVLPVKATAGPHVELFEEGSAESV